MMTRSQLHQVYAATSFFANTPLGKICIRVGKLEPQLDRLLQEHRANTWCFITAHNPASKELPEEENRARQSDLEDEIRSRTLQFFPGEGQGETGNWSEQSILIIDINRPDAEQLARKYGQNAIVYGSRGNAAELIWTNPENPQP
jgi:hypothetical protein